MHLGLGTAAIGRPTYINIRSEKSNAPFDLNTFKQSGLSILEEAYAQGIRYFDTAPGYGMAEQLILEWLQHNPKNDVEVATKWGYKYVANFDPNATQHEIKEHSLKLLNEQWDFSKQLLPNLTTLQIHSATFDSGVLENNEVLARLASLKETNDIHIGLTASGANQVAIVQKALDIQSNGKQLFDVYQLTYNILDQSILALQSDLKDKRVVIKEALANGRVFKNSNYPVYFELYNTLENLSKKYNVGIDAIALQFCSQTINPFKVLSGASNKQQLHQNLRTTTFQLSNSEINALSKYGVSANYYWNERKHLTWN
ncbi:aldo/keto reductase [Urechidicola sp. KH5]